MGRLSALHKFFIRVFILCVWLAQSLTLRDPLDADCIAYLNIARSCAIGNWHSLVNGWWSPGFPFLLSIILRVFKPDRFHDPVVVDSLAFFSLCIAMPVFEYFLKHLEEYRAIALPGDNQGAIATLTNDEIWLLG